MKSLAALLLMAVAAGLLLAANEAPETPLTVLFTGNAHGKLDPCACSSESNMGGVLRRDTALAKLREQHPDALLLEAGGLLDDPSPQNRFGAIAYLKSLRALGYDAVGLGAADLVYGRQFLETHGHALFLSNVRWKYATSPLHQPVVNLRRGAHEVEIVAWVDPAAIYTGPGADATPEDPAAFAAQHLRPNRLTIVLAATTPETAKKWLALPDVEVVINANPQNDITFDPPVVRDGDKLYAEAAIYGSRIGWLQLAVQDGAIQSASHRFVPLDKHVAEGARVRPFFDEYEAETKKLFLAQLAGRPAFDPAKSPYAGVEACAKCHRRAHRVWKKSPHSHAWASLQKARKTFDAECVACHVVGFNKPGGFLSETDTPHLSNVGCEACHGPGKAHVLNKKLPLPKPTLQTCLNCHTAERAPKFVAKKAWPKIKH